ncbi:MAG: hypothetical protein M1483_00920 [Actinobacteria bacterium]|nr:hypothetical protein [Actinomycetota bacterium]MCL6104197.1 hypothetical protein [Actinomycetota bacterium]
MFKLNTFSHHNDLEIKSLPVIGVLLLAATVGLASCSSSKAAVKPPVAKTTVPYNITATVKVVHNALYGPLLADASGQFLYEFKNDTPTKSACAALTSPPCLTIWHPLTVLTNPRGGVGVDQAELGLFKLPNGKEQVTYYGHQLYVFSGDTTVGQINGEGYRGLWFVVSPTGQTVTHPLSTPPSSTSTTAPYAPGGVTSHTATTAAPSYNTTTTAAPSYNTTTTAPPTTSTTAPTTTTTAPTTTTTAPTTTTTYGSGWKG